MNMKKMLLQTLAIGVFLLISDWLIHGVLLADFYENTSILWRSKIEMGGKIFYYMLIHKFVLGYFYHLFYTELRGSKMSWGLKLGFVSALYAFSFYLYMPLDLTAALLWASVRMIHALGAAFICDMLS